MAGPNAAGCSARIAWLTDIHLEWLSEDDLAAFLDSMLAHEPTAVLVGGDIGQADSVVRFLRQMSRRLDRPIYFVLGNHDYYGGSIAAEQSAIRDLCRDDANLTWLDEAGVVGLTPETALVGHGAWADGRYGDFAGSAVMLNDYFLIEELRTPGLLFGHGKRGLLNKLHRLGDAAAEAVRQVLPAAFENHRHVLFLTHVPPFRQACWYRGKPSDDNGLPHFGCKAVGDALLSVMHDLPDRELTVLCGHTHGGGEVDVLGNLRCLTGEAAYGKPVVQRLFEIDGCGRHEQSDLPQSSQPT